LPVDPSDVDLAELISMTVEQYTPIARNEGIALTNTATLARAYVDSDLIVQLLVNLIDNAIAHTPCGGAIEVGSRIEGTQTRLWVDDSGPGIPPGDRERIFDRFYRVDTGRDRASGGAGLGLSICRAIVEAHDGTITAGASDLGGARFNVLLPGQASTPGTGTP
jgi:two-component system, OmpR family, sensor histidine kinase BaeS